MTLAPTAVGQLAHKSGAARSSERGQIRIDDQVLSAFCLRHHIRWLALFGSALRPQDFRPHSDLDMLVDFEPGHVPGFAFVDLADELSVLFGRRVDLHTPALLSPEFRDAVLREAEVLYGATAPRVMPFACATCWGQPARQLLTEELEAQGAVEEPTDEEMQTGNRWFVRGRQTTCAMPAWGQMSWTWIAKHIVTPALQSIADVD